MVSMNVSLSEEQNEFVEARRIEEGYSTASEYLCALIRDAQKRHAKLELESKLLEGLQSPAREMKNEDWAALREKIYERSPELRNRQ